MADPVKRAPEAATGRGDTVMARRIDPPPLSERWQAARRPLEHSSDAGVAAMGKRGGPCRQAAERRKRFGDTVLPHAR